VDIVGVLGTLAVEFTRIGAACGKPFVVGGVMRARKPVSRASRRRLAQKDSTN